MVNRAHMASVIPLPGRAIQSRGITLLRTVGASIHQWCIVQGGEVLLDPGSPLLYQDEVAEVQHLRIRREAQQ